MSTKKQSIDKIRTYYYLTKPGIIYGNLITATGAFLLASKGLIDFTLLLSALCGISLIIASACVLNNYIDQEIDKKMARTSSRALPSEVVTAKSAIIFAVVLGLYGFCILFYYTNTLVVVLGIIAIFAYLVLYSIAKRRSVHGTLVGTISGALPPVAGYCAVTGTLDAAAVILFLIMVLWQLPHFYAIAIYRLNDYKAAGLPVHPVKKGVKATKRQIMLYVIAFTIIASLLSIYGYTGYIYLGVMTMLGLIWFSFGLQGFSAVNDKIWAKKMFLFSLLVIVAFSLLLSIAPTLL